jgi:folate-binding protein YgfZ
MSDALNIDVSHSLTSADAEMSALTPPTVLADELSREQPNLRLASIGGRLTPLAFAALEKELGALSQGCGVYDLGWMTQIAVRGEDRLRWLSGMVTNAVQQLQDGEGNYSFLLNAQGRIQGDAYVFREAEQILLMMEADQAARVLAHLDQFIIMDDVMLESIGDKISSIGIAGPQALGLLAQFQVVPPTLSASAGTALQPSRLCGVPIYLATLQAADTLRYEIWSSSTTLPTLWNHLLTAGAQPCGLASVEALRILHGIPRFGVDITDRDLPQETSQTRALNFDKGCYLGQEIVERIRSRGAVHRALRQLQLSGEVPSLPADLTRNGASVGRLTSAVTLPGTDGEIVYAIGIVRAEAVMRGESLTYNEGTATLLDGPPDFPHLLKNS